MPTDTWFKANPKVSGYVSQAVYDCLMKFKGDRGISISQAMTTVLSEYFGVNQKEDRSSFADVTLAQVQDLREGLASLVEQVEQRFQQLEDKVESIKISISPKVDYSRLTEPSDDLGSVPDIKLALDPNVDVPEIIEPLEQDEESKLLSEPLNKLLDEAVESNTQAECQDVNSVLLSELSSKPLNEEVNTDNSTQSQEISIGLLIEPKSKLPNKEVNADDPMQAQEPDVGLLIELNSKPIEEKYEESSREDDHEQIFVIQPLSASGLGRRLGVAPSVVSRYKSGKRKQTLSEWSQGIDPNGVAWEYSEEKKLYVPVDQSKQKSNLQIELLKT